MYTIYIYIIFLPVWYQFTMEIKKKNSPIEKQKAVHMRFEY